jgi:hypothetical protein
LSRELEEYEKLMPSIPPNLAKPYFIELYATCIHLTLSLPIWQELKLVSRKSPLKEMEILCNPKSDLL